MNRARRSADLELQCATQTVTGSRLPLSMSRARVLANCGPLQSEREHRDRKWNALPVDPESLDAVSDPLTRCAAVPSYREWLRAISVDST